MRGRGGKKSFQQKMMYGFGALFAVSLLAFLVFFIRSYRREMQTEIEHMEEYNQQLEPGQCSGQYRFFSVPAFFR